MLYLDNGYLNVKLQNLPEIWTHVVLNYVGLEECTGIKIYENGRFTAADTTKTRSVYAPAEGRLVIGRSSIASDGRYSSVKLDELMLFDSTLSEDQIRDLSAHA